MQPQQYVQVISYLAVPCFVVFAYRDWTKCLPESLSSWRRRLGLTSMLVISADWCSIIFLIVADKANIRWAMNINNSWFTYLEVAPILAAILAFALKGRARTSTIVAGLSMALVWVTSWMT